MTNQAKGVVAAFLILLGLTGLSFCSGAEAADQVDGVVTIVEPPKLLGYELFYCGELIGVILPESTQHTIGAGWSDLDVLLFDWSMRGGHTVIIHLDKMRNVQTLCPTRI